MCTWRVRDSILVERWRGVLKVMWGVCFVFRVFCFLFERRRRRRRKTRGENGFFVDAFLHFLSTFIFVDAFITENGQKSKPFFNSIKNKKTIRSEHWVSLQLQFQLLLVIANNLKNPFHHESIIFQYEYTRCAIILPRGI